MREDVGSCLLLTKYQVGHCHSEDAAVLLHNFSLYCAVTGESVSQNNVTITISHCFPHFRKQRRCHSNLVASFFFFT